MTTDTTRPVDPRELRRAWRAIRAGMFTDHPAVVDSTTRPTVLAPTWTPDADEHLLVVVGTRGGCGASTVALGLATAAGGPARVVQCSPLSGLESAASAELGPDPAGWLRGSRGDVRIERCPEATTVDRIAVPAAAGCAAMTTVLDVGWRLGPVLATPGWLRRLVVSAARPVLVTEASIPGVQRLENSLAQLDGPGPGTAPVVVVVGPPRRRWPRPVNAALGPLTQAAADAGDLLCAPRIPTLEVTGVDPTPLPTPLLRAAADILDRAVSPKEGPRCR